MRNGRRKHVITIQQEGVTGRDRLNVPTSGWTTWKEVFAAVVPRRGQENFSADGQQRFFSSLVNFSCAFYDVEGLTTKMRIIFDGNTYDIKNIMPDYDGKEDCLIEAEMQQ